LYGNQRIADELKKVPKAKPGPEKKSSPLGGKQPGKAATGIAATSRSRLAL
jgi:hypothetical protein